MLKWGSIVQTSKVSIDGDGCILTSKNIEHPFIQEFLIERGQTGQDLGNGFFKIQGCQYLGGESMYHFLLKRGVDLRKNPTALDKDNLGHANGPLIFKNISGSETKKISNNKQSQEGPLFPGFKKGFLLG